MRWGGLADVGIAGDVPVIDPSVLSPQLLAAFGKGGAAFGASMLPGAGLADAGGMMPNMSGGFSPSLGTNLKNRHYLDAALQGLGAAGDAAYAVPGLALVGATLKAPKGLAEAVKAMGIVGREANSVIAGITKLRAGEVPTANQTKAVEAASRAGLTQARNAIVKANPELKGAPPHITNMDQHREFVQGLRDDAAAGASNRNWYPESAAGLAESFRGQPADQSQIAKMAGMASQQTPVGRDAGIAYRAKINAKNFPIDEPPGTEWVSKQTGEVSMSPFNPGHMYQEVNNKVMSEGRGYGVEPSGGKIAPYTTNLLTGGADPTAAQIAQHPWMAKHLDEQGRNFGVMDTIMHQKYQYGDSAKASGTREYGTRSMREAADDPNAPVSLMQAPIWKTQQGRMGGTGSYNLRDAINEMTGMMNVETTLGSNTGLEKVLRTADMPWDERVAFDKVVMGALTDENGRSKILQAAGLPQMDPKLGIGAYENQFNPVTTFQPVLPAAGPGRTAVVDGWELRPRGIAAEGLGWDGPGSRTMHEMSIPNVNLAHPLDDTTARAATFSALMHQKLGLQKGMGWIRPYVVDESHPIKGSDWFQIDLGRQLTKDEAQAFANAGVAPIVRGNSIGWLDFSGKQNSFLGKLTNAADDIIGSGRYDLVHAPTQRWYFENDWKDAHDATQIDKAIEGLGPEWKQRGLDVQRALAPEVGRAFGEVAAGQGRRLPDSFLRTIEEWSGGTARGAGRSREQVPQALGLADAPRTQRRGLAEIDPFELQ